MYMPNQTKTYNVAIVDDNELFPVALVALMKEYKFINVVGIYKNGKKLVDNFDKILPDIVFTDVIMPEMDGVRATKWVMKKYPETKVIAMSMFDDGYNVKRMLQAGAWSFATKDLTKKSFRELMTSIMQNKRYISSTAAIKYTLHINRNRMPGEKEEGIENNHLVYAGPPDFEAHITRREKQIISFMAQGFTDKEIARELSRSSRTIDAHKQNIMQKLNTRKSTEIVALAYKYNLL